MSKPEAVSMTPKDLGDHWLTQSIEPNLGGNAPFIRFMTAWIGFNALYSDRCASVDGDWNQVRTFASDPHLIKAHDLLLTELPQYVAAIEVLGVHGVRNLRSGRQRHISKKRALEEVLGCVYQVRCNYIHGGKHVENQRDRDLVKAGYVVVANLLSVYLNAKAIGGWERFEERIGQEQPQ